MVAGAHSPARPLLLDKRDRDMQREGCRLGSPKEMGGCAAAAGTGQTSRKPRRPWDRVLHLDAPKWLQQGCNKVQGVIAQPGVAPQPAMDFLGLPEEAHHQLAEGLEIGDS